MKTSSVLVLAVAVILSATTGCKTTPRVTKLPDQGVGRDGLKATGPNDSLTLGQPSPPTAVTGTELPNENKLAGRDEDRATFAAQTVYFEYDRATIRAPEAAKLQQVASAFKARGIDHDLLIEGHCDERGTEEYNRALGERRALALRELLVQSGVDASRVFTRSFGKDSPANTSHDESAWSRNRRGEFVLVLPKKITTTQNTQ